MRHAKTELFDLIINLDRPQTLDIEDIVCYSDQAHEFIDLCEPVDQIDAQFVYTAIQQWAVMPHKINSIRHDLYTN